MALCIIETEQSLILSIDQRAPVWEYKLLGAKQLRG